MSDGALPQEEIDAMLDALDASGERYDGEKLPYGKVRLNKYVTVVADPNADGSLSQEEIDNLLRGRCDDVGSSDNPARNAHEWNWPYPLRGPNNSFVMYPFPVTGYITGRKQKER